MARHVHKLHNIGVGAYERSFGLRFIDEEQLDDPLAGPSADRVLLAHPRQGLRTDLAGRTVALVGNAPLTGCGGAIDAHDVVIRISSMRHWRRDPLNDGARISLWAGNPWFVIHRNGDDLIADVAFDQHVRSGGELWGVSPFHVSVDSYRWLVANKALERFLVSPPPFLLYDRHCACLDTDDVTLIYGQRPPIRNLVGLPIFEILLTGTRILLLLEICGVRSISLFGFNLFSVGSDPLWFGHELSYDRRVILGVRRRLEASGGRLYWHEEPELCSAEREAVAR